MHWTIAKPVSDTYNTYKLLNFYIIALNISMKVVFDIMNNNIDLIDFKPVEIELLE